MLWFCLYLHQLLCAGCGLGEGRVAPVQRDKLGRATFAEKQLKRHILPPSDSKFLEFHLRFVVLTRTRKRSSMLQEISGCSDPVLQGPSVLQRCSFPRCSFVGPVCGPGPPRPGPCPGPIFAHWVQAMGSFGWSTWAILFRVFTKIWDSAHI